MFWDAGLSVLRPEKVHPKGNKMVTEVVRFRFYNNKNMYCAN
jgi:hypothetical protein